MNENTKKPDSKSVAFYIGRANPVLGKEIVAKLGYNPSNVIYIDFSDGEFITQLGESVRDKDVFIIQSSNAKPGSASDNLFEIGVMADAAKRASARTIIAVIPYFGFARQERKSKPRTPITAKLVAQFLEIAGIKRVITMDLHAEAIQGFFDIPVDNLFASYVFVPEIRNIMTNNTIFGAADSGGLTRATKYGKYFHTEVISCYKSRQKANEIEKMMVMGDPHGKTVIIMEDIIDTAGTISKTAKLLIKKGAKEVIIFASFGVLSGKAYRTITNSKIKMCYVTDAHPNSKKFLEKHPNAKIKIISSAEIFAKAIKQVIEHGSVNELFLF